VKDNIIGYASSQHGPRTRDLRRFIFSNKLDIPMGFKLCIEPLMRDVSKDDALEMQFIGRTTLRWKAVKLFSSCLEQQVLKLLTKNLDGIEITLKPKRVRNIRDMAKEPIKNADDSHSDILIKGKEQAADLLTNITCLIKGIWQLIYINRQTKISQKRWKHASYKNVCYNEKL
jgi:hypothetical protein